MRGVSVCALVSLLSGTTTGFTDTASWVGAEYTPWSASNELWWWEYEAYKPTVTRELKLMQQIFGYTTMRMFLHSKLYDADAAGLKRNITDFLGVAEQFGIKIGLVFFDDCWNGVGADLNHTCVPHKGVHNGCWYQSPQGDDRTTVDRFQNYVTDLVTTFDADERVLFFEIYNEPRVDDNFTMTLRDAGYCWAKALNPVTPVIALWDDSASTDIVDHHQYSLPWGDGSNPLFNNTAKGGFITEAGARWYQKTDYDSGSPLTLLHWLGRLKAAKAKGKPAPALVGDASLEEAKHERLMAQCDALRHSGAWSQVHDPSRQAPRAARSPKSSPNKSSPSLAEYAKKALKDQASDDWTPPFVPGVMIDWEVMVGHSQTRWHWGDPEGMDEPPIPWHGHMFPDGTPVSFTEAAAIRRYTTGVDDFLAFETFLNMDPDNWYWLDDFQQIDTVGDDQVYALGTNLSVPGGAAMYELTFWPDQLDTVLSLTIGGDDTGAGALYEAQVDCGASELRLIMGGAEPLKYDIQASGKPQGGIVPASWNMLRLLVTSDSVHLWFNPQFSDVTGGSVPSEEYPNTLVPMPPRLHTAMTDFNRTAAVQPGAMAMRVKSTSPKNSGFRIDYASILPPTLYGLAAEAQGH